MGDPALLPIWEKVLAIDKKLDKIEQSLLGYNGQDGLIRSHEALKRDFYKFKKLCLMMMSFAVGSGALGLSIWQILGAG